MRLIAQLIAAVRAVRFGATSAQISLLISVAAFLISTTQFYLSNFRKISSLTAFVSSFYLDAENRTEQDGDIKFDLTATISMVLTNVGNSPSTLLKVFYVSPNQYALPEQNVDCRRFRNLEWDFYGSEGFGAGQMFGRAFTNRAQVIAPGATVVSDGEMKITGAVRSKEFVGKSRTFCLMFVTLDYAGKPNITSINGGTLIVTKQTSGLGYSETLKSAIDLTSH